MNRYSHVQLSVRNTYINLGQFLAKNYFLAIVVFTAILLIRGNQLLLNAQFWAEDGALFFADAFNQNSWALLIKPYNGYLHLIPRLLSQLSLFIPLTEVPFFFSMSALIFQVLPLFYIMSKRSDRLWAYPYQRWIVAIIYVCLPASEEVFMNITNIQWHLPTMILFILLSEPPRRKSIQIAEYFLICLISLTGPFVFFYSALLVVLFLLKRKIDKVTLLIFGTTSIIQATALLTSQRLSHGMNNFDLNYKINLISNHVILPSFFGIHRISETFLQFSSQVNRYHNFFFIILIVLFTISLFRRNILVSFGFFISFLITYSMILTFPVVTLEPWNGSRYYFQFILSTLMACTVIAFDSKPKKGIQSFARLCLLCFFIFAIPSDFFISKNQAPVWKKLIEENYNPAKPGEKVILPINPHGWAIGLLKR